MKKITFLLAFSLVNLFANNCFSQNIVINEVLASNTNSIEDENGSKEDWVELYNNGPASVNLLGYGLTDDPALPFKWTFPNVTVASGQYLIVWCSDKNRSVAGQPLHTNWKISGSGEIITLTNTSAVAVSTAPAAVLQPDISWGKSPNGTGPYVYFGTPTPNAANTSTGYSGFVNPPSFSQNSGFFTTGFNLTLSSSDAGATILYTLDGSEPDENNLSGTTYQYKNQYIQNPGQSSGPLLNNSYQTFQYAAPLAIVDRSPDPNDVAKMSSTFANNPTYLPSGPIFKGTTVRVKVVKPGFLPSKTITKTYFITPQGASKFSLPVISISLNENSFYDYNNGIYVAGVDFETWRAANPNGSANASKKGNYYREVDDERKANFSYFVGGNEVVSQEVGLRIRGGVSRRFESKSLTVYARSDYGDSTLDYKFFTDLPYTSYERLTLSNSGGDFRSTMFRDALNQNVCKEMFPEKEAYQPAIAFVNGEYWGILNIRERFDDEYFKRVYDADAIDFLENDAVVKDGDDDHYDAMTSYLNSNTLATQTNYDYIKTQLDPENVADYYIANIYFQNEDWPNNNQYFWRNKIASYNANAVPKELDGRWRWMFHDMDNTFAFVSGNYDSNTLATMTSIGGDDDINPAWSTLVFRKLLTNAEFKNYFINRFADLLNTSFLTARVTSKINSMKAAIYPEIPGHIARWKVPATIGDYNYDIDFELDFASERPTLQRDHIRNVFAIASNINATLNVSDPSHGFVKMNTIDVKDGTPGITGNPYPWTGIYFRNIPVKLKAVANTGFAFSHWTGASTSTNPEITITPTANFSITAVFVPTAVETSVPIYFWMMDGTMANNTPLTFLNSTYELASNGVINYQSCLPGYPYPIGDPNRNKASMERRNSPTTINYRPEANGNVAFAAADMKGLQIKQPFQSGGQQNTMVFNFSTLAYKKIKFSFAAIDEGAASAIAVEYSVNAGAPVWVTTGLSASSLPLTAAFQLFEVDFSSITTVDNNPDFKIRLRFTGPNMTADTGSRVTFNNIAVDGVKMGLSYTSPNTFDVGTAITNLNPSFANPITAYNVSPALPSGLSLNTTTGVISGTPTVAAATATYTVTGTTATGNVTFGVIITVNTSVVAPSALSYNSPNIFTKNTAIANLTPTVTGTVDSYSVSPALPTGLSLNTTTGVISGTPTAISANATYTVTATNSGGFTTFGIQIRVNDIAPSGLSYNSPNVFTRNTAISNLNPSVSGGAVISYSVSPALPTGLSLNTTTGVISGTPTAISANATYNVTATNSGGFTTFGIQIQVNDIAPSGLSYNSPNVFTRNTTISNLNPSVSGGAVISYSVSPALPTGLSLNTTTGVISGTPSVVSANATYTITATNSGGFTTFGIQIRVNDIAPSGLSYNSPNVFTRNTTISNLNPSVSGGAVISYSVSPALPTGLSLNTTTGVISGTPTVVSANATYTVTATNSGGFTTFGIQIQVNDITPSGLSYNSPNVFTRNTAISNLNPSVSGGAVISYSVSPALPTGLSLNTTTGVISGTPTVVSANATYTVTATNSGGFTTFGIQIQVNDVAPSALSYNSPNVFTVGTLIGNLSPSASGTVISYSVSPALPSGLSLNTSTGVISGTPTVVSANATYTVTATNSGGFTTFGIQIQVNDIAPSALSYNSPNIFIRNTAISNLNPSVSGGAVISYSITPALPTGLSLNTTTGVISGTPTVVSANATYTVTATNSGGFTTFGVQIQVNDIAPSALSYNSPNIFTRNTAISNLNPSVSGGTVISYGVSPALPTGLSLNTTTGVISGTPSAVSANATYTVTATNSGGFTTFGIQIQVNDVAPSALSYNSPNVFTVGTLIGNLLPSVSGNAISYSVSPALPTGLSLNTTTGVISGTPTVVSANATYTITATNSGGFTTFGIQIRVNDIAPSGLSYNSPNVFTRNTAISNLNPSVSGGALISYSVSPALPTGLSLNTTTGVISGTPTVVSANATYTVTATNSGGFTTFGIQIQVNDIAPSALSYNSPNIFTRNTAISNLNPSVSGGTVISYSVSPALPTGLSLNTTTGVISGTPSVVSANATYTVTATNSGGFTTFGIQIQVNDIAPSALSYNSPNVFTVGTLIGNLSPSVSGTVISYSVSPALPTGLSLNTSTGVISGTPTVVSANATYTVTATNSGGFTTFGIQIRVNDITPSGLSYNSPNTFTRNTAISNLNPSVSGGAVISYGVSPALPTGLSLNTTTGVISGTPSVVSANATYTITATNSGGFTTFGIQIQVNDVAPSALSYNSPNVFTVGTLIGNLSPSVSGTVISYSVSPALPTGLFLNTSTGVISGTPSVVSDNATYTVTATNSGGFATFGIQIQVNAIAPSALSYNSPNVFTVGTLIGNLSPAVSGNVISYGVSPALPTGLSLNTSTGVISGTPTVVSANTTYTVTATNSGGFTTFGIQIQVNDIAPSALSYNSPNVFTVGTLIGNLSPSVSGTVISYGVSPALPTGLSLNTTTGVISGTPTVVSANATYTVTATNSGGFTTFGIQIQVNDIAPSGLSYNSPNVFTVGSVISNLSPSVSGTVISYSVSPALPNGLSLNTSTGVISGTPTVVSANATYTITATNSGGFTTFGIQIQVNDIAPSGLSYPSPNVFTVGNTISNLTPTVSGGVVESYSVSPALPNGLSLDTVSGVISGTPTTVTATGTYTVTAVDSGGSDSFGIVITVNDVAPSALSYNSPNVFTVGSVISNLSPSVSGTVVSYSVSPALPSGLSLNASTGVISGTPTVVSANATYTVTATNSGGFTTFGIQIQVNDIAPSALSYNSPNVFTVGTLIGNLSPSISGTVISYSVSPALPTGLSLNTTTGVISGTPSVVSANATYTVTATNSGGFATFGIQIQVNDIAPSALGYPNPNIFTKNQTISSLIPSIAGGTVLLFTITPDLPEGLGIDPVTGIISGMPTTISPTTVYTVTAVNSGGSTTFDLTITVNDIAPGGLSYPNPNVFIVGDTISNLFPSFSGTITGFTVSPDLPAGLSIDPFTGMISGTPTAVTATAVYTVIATNSGGSVTFDITITVNDVAPTALSYPNPNVFTINSAIAALVPSIAGNVTTFSIVPALPDGLVLDAVTGIISGTPTVLSAQTIYTITATNSGGNVTFDISITVNDVAPTTLSYPNPNVFTINSAIAALVPSIAGNVTTFSIVPALPNGLVLDAVTGIISGAPTVLSAETIYTITATNSGGSATFDITITVNDIAPTTLSYPNPNIFTINSAIAALVPSIAGNVTSFGIVPALPDGLVLDTVTGIISGTPTALSAETIYTITATNSGGSATFDITITVNEMVPTALSYPNPNVFTINSAIAALVPSVTGNVTSFGIVPALPNGLVLDAVTGIISGTPTALSAETIYTITATNSGGSVTFDISITVNEAAPTALSYTANSIFTVGVTIADLLPTVTGNVTSYSIFPTLPDGLVLDTNTGIISGTSSVPSPATTYTVTATNSGGSVTFDLVITVENVMTTITYGKLPVKVYPNPFVDRIEVSGITKNAAYELYSIDGKKIQHGRLENAQTEFSNLPSGTYLLQLSDADRVEQVKLIKR